MSYVNKELKFIVGSIVGFVLGVIVAGIVSELVFDGNFILPLIVICAIGIPVLICTRRDMKSALITIAIIIACIVAVFVFRQIQLKQQMRSVEKSFDKYR